MTPWQRMMWGDTPCRLCENYKRCSYEEIACDRFQHFVECGEIELSIENKPNKEKFMEIYYEEDITGEF